MSAPRETRANSKTPSRKSAETIKDDTNIDLNQHVIQILEAIRRMEPKLNKCDDKLETLSQTVEDIREEQNKKIESMSTEIACLHTEMSQVKYTNVKLTEANKALDEKVTRMECYSRRNNLIFLNVPESDAPLSRAVATCPSGPAMAGPVFRGFFITFFILFYFLLNQTHNLILVF